MIEKLCEGGMGVVYKAEDRKVMREVLFRHSITKVST
jgi:serine/threonine protein kinase